MFHKYVIIHSFVLIFFQNFFKKYLYWQSDDFNVCCEHVEILMWMCVCVCVYTIRAKHSPVWCCVCFLGAALSLKKGLHYNSCSILIRNGPYATQGGTN